MKLPTLFSVAAIASPALACLEAVGLWEYYIVQGGAMNWSQFKFAFTNDNGETTCDSAWGWRIDQDNHWSMNCLPGYVYAVKQDFSMGWYANPSNSFSFTISPYRYGATDDGIATAFNQYMFGC
jgi:hypothetical protein